MLGISRRYERPYGALGALVRLCDGIETLVAALVDQAVIGAEQGQDRLSGRRVQFDQEGVKLVQPGFRNRKRRDHASALTSAPRRGNRSRLAERVFGAVVGVGFIQRLGEIQQALPRPLTEGMECLDESGRFLAIPRRRPITIGLRCRRGQI